MKNFVFSSLIALLALQTGFFLLSTTACGETPSREHPLVVDKERAQIQIAGYVQAREFNRKPFLSIGHVRNYHAIAWEGGNVKKSDILFVSYADDLSIHNALMNIGGIPGNNLTLDTWNKRGYPLHPEPNKKVEGTQVKVSVAWEGAPRNYSIQELLNDTGGKGITPRFGGNKEHIPVWKSGCILCLYSCPGGKISNASYTVNDYAAGSTHFSAREDILPSDGTEVIITLSLN
ncbi:MAG: hypothetical protein HZA01_11640 [Nitrospinae bacterium]|nr:hypothetical protein [Nitrospinota bacterium]